MVQVDRYVYDNPENFIDNLGLGGARYQHRPPPPRVPNLRLEKNPRAHAVLEYLEDLAYNIGGPYVPRFYEVPISYTCPAPQPANMCLGDWGEERETTIFASPDVAKAMGCYPSQWKIMVK